MNFKIKIILVGFICFFFTSCNKSRFGSEVGRPLPRKITLTTEQSRLAQKDPAGALNGIGELSLRSTHALKKVACVNCIQNQTNLSFVNKGKVGEEYVFATKFMYAYVEITQLCELELSLLYEDRDLPVVKRYNLTLCPMNEEGILVCENANTQKMCDNVRNKE